MLHACRAPSTSSHSLKIHLVSQPTLCHAEPAVFSDSDNFLHHIRKLPTFPEGVSVTWSGQLTFTSSDKATLPSPLPPPPPPRAKACQSWAQPQEEAFPPLPGHSLAGSQLYF